MFTFNWKKAVKFNISRHLEKFFFCNSDPDLYCIRNPCF